MLKVKASDPGFDWFYFLVTMYSAYKNNHLFYDLKDIPRVELNSEIESIRELIDEYIKVGEL